MAMMKLKALTKRSMTNTGSTDSGNATTIREVYDEELGWIWVRNGAQGAVYKYGAICVLDEETQVWKSLEMVPTDATDPKSGNTKELDDVEQPLLGIVVNNLDRGALVDPNTQERNYVDRIISRQMFGVQCIPTKLGIKLSEGEDPIAVANQRFAKFAESRKARSNVPNAGGHQSSQLQ